MSDAERENLTEADAKALARKAGAYFAARRAVVTKPCAVCGKLMQGLRQRRYCSDSCRARAYQLRHHDAYLARRRERERAARQRRPRRAENATEPLTPAAKGTDA